MDSAELIAATRITGALPEADPTYSDSRILEELHNALTTVFGRPIVITREGYWRRSLDVAVTADRTRYRLPHRAVIGSAEAIGIFQNGSQCHFKPDYTFEGDQIVLSGLSGGAYTLRIRYYLRPSKLVEPQEEGRVTAVDPSALTVTLDSLPLDQESGLEIDGTGPLDIVHSNGWHELSLAEVTPTGIAGNVVTFPAGTDLEIVEVGDYLRAADQTDWPALPDDFHRTLADAAAVQILLSKGDLQKAQALSSKVNSDLERFVQLMQPRVKDTPGIAAPSVRMTPGTRWRRWGWP